MGAIFDFISLLEKITLYKMPAAHFGIPKSRERPGRYQWYTLLEKFLLDLNKKYCSNINHLVELVMDISGKSLSIKHIPGPEGVRGRNSDNRLIKEILGWEPDYPLRKGLELTYKWIENQVRISKV